MADQRLEAMERQLRQLARRLERLEEGAATPGPAGPAPVGWAEPLREEPRTAAQPEPRTGRPVAERGIDLEELLGGRLLAWLGGIAILLGVVFFFGMAISRGWIDEPSRTVLAFLGSSALLLAGVWLYEREGRLEAALAAVASALSGLFVTLVVATQLYQLIPAELGLACAALVGAVAVAIAVRWDSKVVAAIGILGALSAPVMVGAGTTGASLAFVAVALAAAVAVLLWQRWNWLSLGAFAISSPQLLAWLGESYEERLVLSLAVLAAFWALYMAAAIGYELRARAAGAPPVASWLVLAGAATLVAGGGYLALEDTGHPDGAIAWIVGVAAAHIGLGAFALRQPIHREVGSLLVGTGLALSAIAFADALDGVALVAGWATLAVVLAYLSTRASAEPRPYGSDAVRLMVGSAVFLALALGHALLFEARPDALLHGVDGLRDALMALGASAAAALACGRLLGRVDPRWSSAAGLVGAAALIYLASVTIIDVAGVTAEGDPSPAGQVWLSAFWTLTGLGGLVYGLLRGDRRLRLGGLTLLGIAIAKVYTYDLAELEELARVLSFVALGLLLLAGAFAYQRVQVGTGEERGDRRRSGAADRRRGGRGR